MSHPDTTDCEPKYAWVISLAFWLSLLLSASCFAAVALAPKLLDAVTTDAEYQQNQTLLVALEQQVSYLERVRDALENDREFAAELARVDFDVARAGDERIAVDPAMSLDAAPSVSSSVNAGRQLYAYVPLLELLARDQAVRTALLILAAIVTLAAFTFLHEPRPDPDRPAGGRCDVGIGRLIARYRKPPDKA